MARAHRKTVQKDLQDPDNHDGVINNLEPDILEGEIKLALGSITTNKASEGAGIPVELFFFIFFLFFFYCFKCFYTFFIVFYFLNFKIFNSYMHSQT